MRQKESDPCGILEEQVTAIDQMGFLVAYTVGSIDGISGKTLSHVRGLEVGKK